ncbi:FAD-dependent oxidoreductase [Alterinioella nitratireducens]|uniref:FAD-dependent oxidoreductase n=1 Tax=Alterinioella nitratireducens TaxID=2735915 RepID=UPI004059B70D
MTLQIGIAGAGIGGLSAAALLAADGHRVTLFDQFARPAPVGSGLVVQPVGMAVLDAMGAGRMTRDLGQRLDRMAGDEATSGRRVLDVRYGRTPERQGLGIHRAALFHAIHRAAIRAGVEITPEHRATGRDGRYLHFGARREGPFDLIVDACGAGSPLSPLTARALPYGAVWATVPWPEDSRLPRDHLSQRYRRADRMLGVLPVGSMPSNPGQPLAAIFYSLPVAHHPDWLDQDFEDWRKAATDLWPAFGPYLGWIEGHAAFTFASYSHGTLRRPWDSGIAHIGDAAHRASPQLGQGANMALLDARALQLALRQARGDEALRLYAGARRWHVRAYQTMSAAFTPQYQSDSRVLPVLRDRVLAPMAGIWPVTRVLTRLVCGDLVPPMPALTPRRGKACVRAR